MDGKIVKILLIIRIFLIEDFPSVFPSPYLVDKELT